jgi:hypothetical protein
MTWGSREGPLTEQFLPWVHDELLGRQAARVAQSLTGII